MSSSLTGVRVVSELAVTMRNQASLPLMNKILFRRQNGSVDFDLCCCIIAQSRG